MDTRLYSQLCDAIVASKSPAALVATGELVRATEMHPLERSALERAIAVRLVALSATDTEVPRAQPERAD